jgi:ATP-dependent helicase HrpB
MTRLETVRVSRAAADQRRGRAGRLAPGVCYRLWDEAEHHHLAAHGAPEIREADLAPLALELAAAGAAADALRWLDPPPPAAMAQARELLAQLGALGPDGRVTAHGRRMADLGLHPRLAHMALRGAAMGAAGPASDLAALLAERDVLRAPPGVPADPDVTLRLELLRPARRGARRGGWAHRGPRRAPARARGGARLAPRPRRRRRAGGGRRGARGGCCSPSPTPTASGAAAATRPAASCCATGSAPRSTRSRARARGVHRRRGARRAAARVARLPRGAARRRRRRAPPRADVTRETVVAWDDAAGAVRARAWSGSARSCSWTRRRATPTRGVADALLAHLRRAGRRRPPWTAAARGVQQRVAFLRGSPPTGGPTCRTPRCSTR